MSKLSIDEKNSLLSRFAKLSSSGNKVAVNSNTTLKRASFKDFLLYKKIVAQSSVAKQMGLENPFMQCHDSIAKAHTKIHGLDYINFATYDYLGLNADKRINDFAYSVMQELGTSATASRLVAGEKPIHEIFENEIAKHYKTEAAICFVSGHATNVSVISTLFGKNDLIVYDRLSHNSIMLGAQNSQATTLAFAHNDMEALAKLLEEHRNKYQNVLIVTEGVFSMDGDVANLPRLIELKKQYNAFLMVDEAHALGVVGENGLGSHEYHNVSAGDIDIFMGTLSKTLCSCGGYIAGKKELIEILKYYAPAFVYSVGLSPVLAAASYKALLLLHSEKAKIEKLKQNIAYTKKQAQAYNLNIGCAGDSAVFPIIIGSSLKATILSNLLFKQGILALPIIFPAVEEEKARIRLFLSAEHSFEDIDTCLKTIQELLPKAQDFEAQFIKKDDGDDK